MARIKIHLYSALLLLTASISNALESPRPYSAGELSGRPPWTLLNHEDRRNEGYDIHIVPQDNVQSLAAGGGSCATTGAKPVQAPKKNLWWGLTKDEATGVRAFLKKQKGLDFKKAMALLSVNLLLPNKTTTLPYLDNNSAEPGRYAKATIFVFRKGGSYTYVDGEFRFVMVGPLPIQSGKTTWSYLTYPYSKASHGRITASPKGDTIPYFNLVNKYAKSVADITTKLGWGVYTGNRNDTISTTSGRPLQSADGKKTYIWSGFVTKSASQFDIQTLLPLGLYFGFDVTPEDEKDYKFLGWLYNNELFPTAKALRNAIFSNKVPHLEAPSQGGPWAETDQHGPVKPLDHLYPPISIAPGGARYTVDEREKYVKWMDFEFYFTFPLATGLRLFDIRYKGNRVIYELGMEEALAHYAGNDPLEGSRSYFDTFGGFAAANFPLVPGYDCPSYATYFGEDVYHGKESARPQICLFEMDAGYPMSRHTGNRYISNVKNIFLTLRSISTVGNYDYMTNYQFYMDGSIRVEVRASGYIEGAYYAANEDYGYKIHEALSGGLHDHVLNFKADFDIMGLENSMQAVEVVPTSQVYPWSLNTTRNSMKLNRRIVASEDESKLFWGSNGATSYIITNQDRKNKYGEAPGYRIYPEGAVHLVAQQSSNLLNGAEFSDHDLFVTKRKDTEPHSCDGFNVYDLINPLVRFNDFFNGESLEQTDLVTWFNLGMHHVPNTQDLPNTVFTTAKSSVYFQPINYNLPGNPSVETVNMVRLGPGKGKTTLFGQDQGMCSVEYESQTTF